MADAAHFGCVVECMTRSVSFSESSDVKYLTVVQRALVVEKEPSGYRTASWYTVYI